MNTYIINFMKGCVPGDDNKSDPIKANIKEERDIDQGNAAIE